MVHPRVTKALNPHKRKLTARQIRFFGSKRQKAALKAKRRASGSHKHRAASRSNPKPKRKATRNTAKRRTTSKARNTTPKVVYRTKYKTRTRNVYVQKPKPRRKVKAKANPKKRRAVNPLLMTLSPVVGNPKKRRTSMAANKHKRRRAKAGHSGKRRRNPTRRRAAARRNTHRARSRNPFGQSTTTIVETGFGVILGVSGSKLIPRQYPAQWTSSPTMSILSTGITAGILAWAAAKFIRGPIATGVLMGGAAQTLNVAINAFAPPSIGQYVTLGGMGDFVNGGFPLPQGPVRMPLAASPYEAPNGSQVNVGAFGRAW